MMSTSREPDLDDLFDLEQKYDESQETEGYNYGLELGEKDGRIQGHAAGLEHGRETASEIGYYFGFTTAWMCFLKLDTSRLTDKSSKYMLNKLEQLLKMLEGFPRENNDLVENNLTVIRSKFRQVMSLLKLDITNLMYTSYKH